MALSGNIDGSLNARDIVRMAFLLLGAPLENGEPNAEDGLVACSMLNYMLKSWQSQGCNLWRLSDETLAVPADTPTVVLDPRVLDVMEARYVQSATFQRQLARWEWSQYRALPNKLSASTPTCFSLNKQRTYIEMTLWPVNTEDQVILYSAARVIEDVTTLDDDVDLPQEWTETAYTCLAERLIPVFNIDTLSPGVAQRVTARAQALYQSLLDFDRPGSVNMAPWVPYQNSYPQ